MNLIDLKIKKKDEYSKLPVLSSEGAGCYDLFAHNVSWTKKTATVYTGLSFEIPETHTMLIFPRSSISKYPWILANSVGVIDSDYRGEVMFVFKCTEPRTFNNTFKNFPYKIGSKIGQFMLVSKQQLNLIEVESLSETERGSGGFGSTGE